MKLNKIAISTQLIPKKYLTKHGFVRHDVDIMVVFLTGSKKKKKENYTKICKYCDVLQKDLIEIRYYYD